MSTAIVSVRDLTHRFPTGVVGLESVSLDIYDDEFLLVAGPNGSGKTVLMLHLVGLLEPTAGSILYRGRPIAERIDEVRRKIGIVFQNPASQFLGQTVREDVGFGLENDGLSSDDADARIRRAMKLMAVDELSERRPPYLSGGEQRKVALAGLLARDPEILILDEPFIGLDLLGVRSILRAVLSLRERRHTIVVITHDVEKVLAHADRVVVMSSGNVVENGTPDEVSSRLESYNIRRPPGPVKDMTWLTR